MKTSLIALTLLTLTLSACGTKPVQRTDADASKVQDYNATTGAKNSADSVHGKETAVWYGAVLGGGGSEANGIAFVHRFSDGSSVFTVNLNILPAAAGEYYSASLKNAAGAEVDGGKLASLVGDARHSLSYETDQNLDGYTSVQIYKNAASGKSVVAQGTLKLSPSK